MSRHDTKRSWFSSRLAIVSSVSSVLLLLVASARAQTVDFDTARYVGSGYDAAGMVVGDVDGDGFPDVVTLENVGSIPPTGAARLYAGDGTGRFAEGGVVFSEAVYSGGLADLDRDGRLDLLVTRDSGPGRSLVLMRNDRDGGFVLHDEVVLTMNDRELEIEVGDFDGDGGPDVAVRNGSDGLVYILIADASGGLSHEHTIRVPAGSSSFESFAVADPDEDGLDDVLATTFGSGLSRRAVWFRNDRGLGFLPAVDLPAAVSNPTSVTAGRFDGDMHVDVAVLGRGEGVSVLFGDGLGRFTAGPLLPIADPRELGAPDVNGDGLADVAVLHSFGREVSVHLADGSGGFSTPVSMPPLYGSRWEMRDLGFADLDADGRGDFLAIYEHPGADDRVIAVLGDARGSFELARRIEGSSPYGVRAMLLEDLDGDGLVDIVESICDGTIRVMPGAGGGDFLPPESFPTGGNWPLRPVAGDFDGDGIVDLAIPHWGVRCAGTLPYLPERVTLLLGEGDGGFGPPRPFEVGYRSRALAAADFDEDGHLDLVVACEGDGEAIEPATGVLLGDGDGGFAPAFLFDVGLQVRGLVVGDWDRDGHVDLARSVDESLRIDLGAGDGTFAHRMTIPVAERTADLATADFNGDGVADLSVLVGFSDGFLMLEGNGTGDFLERTLLTPGPPRSSPVVADFDEDGIADLAAASLGNDGVVVFRGRGHWQFDAAELVATDSPESLAAADLDGDGHTDLVAHGVNDGARILRNRAFHPLRCRRGNVDAAAGGPIADVLLVNGSPGAGAERRTIIDLDTPLVVTMELPPSRIARARFVLHTWVGEPTDTTTTLAPYGIGMMCHVPLLVGDSDRRRHTLNNLGRFRRLGRPTHPSDPAPSTIGDLPTGIGRTGTFFLQGLIVDDQAPNGRLAVTNGLLLEVR